MLFVRRRLPHAGAAMVALGAVVLSGIASCGSDASDTPDNDIDGGSLGPDTTNDNDGSTTPEKVVDPDDFAAGDVDVTTVVRSTQERKPISPLLYGINNVTGGLPAGLEKGITFVRRGGDRANAYNWETNVSNGSWGNNFSNDLYLAETLDDPNTPAAVDLALINANRAAGRGSMVPFVLNDWVAGPIGGAVPYDDKGGFNRSLYFKRVSPVKPTALSATPDLGDGNVYTDEHFAYMRSRFQEDIYAPGPTQVMVGIDNEPDLYSYNFPMLQSGTGDPIYAENGVQIGTQVTGTEFTQRFLKFAKRIKELAPTAMIVGPSHYHFDGWTTWHGTMSEYSNAGDGKWYMDDFLATTKTASEAAGKRLLDTWDFHWYPQPMKRGTFVWDLDDSVRKLTDDEIEAIVQGPRSYWDRDYNEGSWITDDHLMAPAYIIERLQQRIQAAYPGTELGVSEYFPGGCAHISSGLAVADTLGIFARMGVHLAAMWPTCNRLEFAYGAIKLLRDADGKGVRFADTVVRVEHPEKVESSVYAGSDDKKRLTVLVINKTDAARKIGLRAFHTSKLGHVDIYRIDSEHADPTLAAQESLTKTNAYAYAAPPKSAAMLVFTAAE